MSWDESRPRRSDLLRDFGLVVRSHKTEFRAGIEDHFYWTDSSGASGGESRLTIGLGVMGSCRAFYDVESNVSAFRDGSLYLTSDTTRLYGLTSVSSFLLSSTRAVRAVTTGALGTGLRVLIQSGEETSVSDVSVGISFPTAYGAPPSVMITAGYPGAQVDAVIGISGITASGFTAVAQSTGAGNISIFWRSMGTVAI